MESVLSAIPTFVLVHLFIFAMNVTMDRMKEDVLFAEVLVFQMPIIVKNVQLCKKMFDFDFDFDI